MNYHKLKTEVKSWITEGIISDKQGSQILARYEHEVPVYKTMRFWLMSLAVVLLGFSLFLVISANWQHMAWPVQSLIALVPLFAAHAWAVRSELREQRLNADLGWFAASIALGANIMLQAQIFHISAYYPNGVLFWVIGILPVLWLRPTTITYLLAAALFILYLGMQASHDQFALLSFLPLVVLIRFAWLRQTAINLFALLAVLYTFSIMLLANRELAHPGFMWELGMLALALALIQQFRALKEREVLLLTVVISLAAHLIALILTFKYTARALRTGPATWVALVIILLAVASLLRPRKDLREQKFTWVTLCNVAGLFALGLVGGFFETGEKENRTLTIRIGANLIYLGSLVALLFHAISMRTKRLFLAAACGLLLWTWLRYLDLFQNYLVTALIFALSAVALVGLNKLWERKYEQ